MIRLALLLKLDGCCSFRSIGRILKIVGLSKRVISHSTILVWMKKMGHFLLHQSQERAQDWILILDESVEFGHSSLLVILGIRQSQLPEDRPLQAQDMACLFIGKASSWKGLDISHILNQLQQQLGRVIYVVSDKGNNLKKAIDLVNWQRVYDLNHFIAGNLKRLYEKNEAYQRFHKAATHMRRYQCLSKAACLLPPVQRAKARFLNVDKLCTWGRKILQLLDRLSREDPMYKAVQWVKQHQSIIKELCTGQKIDFLK